MKRTFKILSAMLALVMLFSMTVMFASCGKDVDDGAVSDAAVTVYAEEGLPELEVKDLGGMEIKFLWPEMHSDGHYLHNEISVTENTGDVIDNAVATRNTIVQAAYNVKITSELEFISTIPKTIRTQAQAGESTYSAIASTIKFMTPIAQEGLLTDFNSLEYYDESHPWWNHDLMQGFSIANARYFGTGDIIYSDDFYPYCTYVNTKVSQSYGITDNYYELVKNKEWTLEKFHTLAARAVDGSIDGDPNTWSADDMNGAVINSNFVRAAYYSAGKGMLEFDAAGYPIWQMTVERTQGILEKVIDIIHKDSACFNSDVFDQHAIEEIKIFTANKTLFLVEELIISERITKSDNKADFMLLPYPLYNEDAEYTCVLNDSLIIGIPVMAANKDDIGLVLSAMSRESIATLTPAFFETVLKYRYMQDPDSVETLQTILNSTVAPDVATVQDWGGFMAQFKALATSNNKNFSSYFAQNIGVAMGELEKYNVLLDTYYDAE